MNISFADARHVAQYLSMGAFERKYRDISIKIGTDAEIGIQRHGRKYALYVRRGKKIDKKARVPMFTSDVELKELTGLVAAVIEQSVLLSDVELDLRGVPAIAPVQPINNHQIPDEQEYLPRQNYQNPVSVTEPEVFEEEYIPEDVATLEEPVETDEEETFVDDKEPEFTPEEIDEMFKGEPVPHTETEIVDGEVSYISGDPEFIPPKEGDTTDNEYLTIDDLLDDEDESSEEVNEEVAEKPFLEDNFFDKKKPTKAYTKSNNTSKDSYLSQVIGTNEEAYDKITKVIKKLVENDKVAATEIYTYALIPLVERYNNDMTRLAKDLDIDERDIMLALYEYRHFRTPIREINPPIS